MTRSETMTPLVLLHAFPLDHRLFAGLPRLPFPVLTPDLPGFGAAELPAAEPDLDLMADAVVALLDRSGVDRAVVGGVSMGGYVALNLLARYPARLAGLILADTKVDADTEPARAERLDRAAAADRGELPTGPERVSPMVAPGTDSAVLDLLGRIAADQTDAAVAWAQRAMAARPDTAAVLAGTELPVLVIVGELDPVTGPAFAHTMADLAEQATLVVIPGAGHLSPAEAPAAFAAAVETWWSDTGL